MKKVRLGIVALAVKLGPKLVVVVGKLAKGLKLGKVGLAGVSAASYAYLFTWQFALMLMALIFIHECGHLWAMKHYGIKTKGVYFIPFFGGVAVAEGAVPSKSAEVVIAIMGPVWGLGLTLLSGAAYYATGLPIFAAAASWMALINLFNLFPVLPLDGGRILKAVAYSVHSTFGKVFMLLSLVAAGFMAFRFGIPIFAFLAMIATFELLSEFGETGRSPVMDHGGVAWSLASYGCVAAILFGTMVFTKHIPGAELALNALKGL